MHAQAQGGVTEAFWRKEYASKLCGAEQTVAKGEVGKRGQAEDPGTCRAQMHVKA